MTCPTCHGARLLMSPHPTEPRYSVSMCPDCTCQTCAGLGYVTRPYIAGVVVVCSPCPDCKPEPVNERNEA